MSITTQPIAYTVSVKDKWVKVLNEAANVIGTKFQNQHTTAKFWVASQPVNVLEAAFRIDPGTGIIEDILPDTGEVWIYSDTVGHVVTIQRKFKS